MEYNDISPYKDGKILIKNINSESNNDVDKNENYNNSYPKNGYFCEITYNCYLYNDNITTEIDEESKTCYVIELGKDEIIKGLEISLLNMYKNQSVEIIVDSDYAFGDYGFQSIPPNAKLKYILTLHDFYAKTSFKFAMILKEKGVNYFKNKEYDKSISEFQNSRNVFSNIDLKEMYDLECDKSLLFEEFSLKVNEFKQTLLLNLGNCYNKTKRYAACIDILNKYLEDSNGNEKLINPKAYYFKGLSLIQQCLKYDENFMNFYGEAKRSYLKLVDKVPPNDAGVIEIREKLDMFEDQIKNKSNDDQYNYLKQTNKKSNFLSLYDDKEIVIKPTDIPQEINSENPLIFLDIKYGNNYFQIEVELFNNIVPKTVENFRCLLTGERIGELGEKFTLVGTKFYRIIKDFMMEGGDIENNDGTGGFSIYGKEFEDENFKLNHNEEGILSMSNIGPNTNSSKFIITFSACQWLNGRNVVFGKIRKGMDCLKELENKVLTDKNDKPLEDIEIVSCGEIFKKL